MGLHGMYSNINVLTSEPAMCTRTRTTANTFCFFSSSFQWRWGAYSNPYIIIIMLVAVRTTHIKCIHFVAFSCASHSCSFPLSIGIISLLFLCLCELCCVVLRLCSNWRAHSMLWVCIHIFCFPFVFRLLFYKFHHFRFRFVVVVEFLFHLVWCATE